MIRKGIVFFVVVTFSFLAFGNYKNNGLFKIESKLILVKHFNSSINSEICNKILAVAVKGEKKYGENEITIMKYSPKVFARTNQKAEMVLSSKAQYFEPISVEKNTYKLCTIASNKAPGMNLSLVLNKTGENEFKLDYLLKLRFINGREGIKQVNLEVGKPYITTVSTDNKVNLKLNEWTLIAKKKLELVDEKNAVVLIAVKASEYSDDK
jgi:hypothetical protein